MFANVAQALGVDSVKFMEMMKSDDIELATRTAWKYSCSRKFVSMVTRQQCVKTAV